MVDFTDDVKFPLLTSQCPISIRLTMEKVQPCLQWGQGAGHCPEFLLQITLQPSRTSCQLSECLQLQPFATAHVAAKVT